MNLDTWIDGVQQGDPLSLGIAAAAVVVALLVVVTLIRRARRPKPIVGRSPEEACRMLSMEIREFRDHLAPAVETAAALFQSIRMATGAEAGVGRSRRKANHTLGLRFPDPASWMQLAAEAQLDARHFADLDAAVKLAARTAVAWDAGKYDNSTRPLEDLTDIEKNLRRPIPLANICVQAAERRLIELTRTIDA